MTNEDYNLISGYTWLARQRCNNNFHDAEDLMQDIFLKILNNLEKFESLTYEGKRSYIYASICNKHTDMHRGRTRRPLPVELTNETNIKSSFHCEPAAYAIVDLKETMKAAKENKFTYATLLQASGYSIKEIQVITNLKQNTVLTHIFQGRKYLKKAA